MAAVVAAATVIALCSGCCALSRRDCFAPCPPPRTVTIDRPCKLPPKLHLPAFARAFKGCPEAYVCFDRDNAATIASRLASMSDWIVEARKRCGPLTTSQPAR